MTTKDYPETIAPDGRGGPLFFVCYKDTAAYRRKIGKPTRSDISAFGEKVGRMAWVMATSKYGIEACVADFDKRTEGITSSVYKYEVSIGRELDNEERRLFLESAIEGIHEEMSG